jgi:hypothetical protein
LSSLDSKLERPRTTTGGKARARADQLLERWGSWRIDPNTIAVDTIGGRELWRRVTGDLFEQQVRS